MIVIPAIDLMEGKPVRLYQGKYDQKEIVADSAVQCARTFEKAGAGRIHIVDLDGAKAGRRINDDLILSIRKAVKCELETGGGIRTKEDIDFYLSNGIDYVILGTAALYNEELLRESLQEYGERIIVSLDCMNGYARSEGWLNESGLYYTDAALYLEKLGVRNIIFTDIAFDGTLNGVPIDELKILREKVPSLKITASGGIGSMQDLSLLKKEGIDAAVTGKAVYDERIDLKEAIRKMEK